MLKLDLPIGAALAAVAGPVLFARSFRDLRTRRLMLNTPTARIRSMAMGLVEINGTVVAHGTHRAPFSGHECAYWEVDIATRSSGRQGWSIVHRNSSGNPFYVRDETGLALVYPSGSECKVRFGVSEECYGISLPQCYADYMSEQHLGLLWRLSMIRFRERLLESGQRVYVLGSAMPRPEVHDISDAAALEATGTNGISDRTLETLHEQTVAVVRRGQNEPTFIISQESERELALELGSRALGKLVAGSALTLFGLGYWLYALSSRHVLK